MYLYSCLVTSKAGNKRRERCFPDMKKDLLLVIDMQNVYAGGGAWCCPKAEEAAGKIKKLINEKASGIDVIFTRFIAGDEPEGTWKDYNRENAEINNDPYANGMMDVFSEELKKYPLYTKSVYSSLAIPEVKEAAKNAGKVLVAGVVTECCVLSTVMSLIDEGAYVLYLKDCAAGLDKDMEQAVEKVLKGLEPLQVKVIGSEDY